MKRSNIFSLMSKMLLGSRKQTALFCIILGSIVAVSAISSALPILFSLGIDRLTGGPQQNSSSGLLLIVGFAAGLLITSVITQLEWLTYGPFNLRLQRHLTIHVFNHALSLPFYALRRRNSHEISRIVEKGLDAVREITSNIAFFVAPTVIELIIAGFALAFMVDLWMSLALCAALAFYGYLANLSAEKIRAATENAMESGVRAWTHGLDAFVNIEQVQQANLKTAIMDEFYRRLKANDRDWNSTFSLRAFYGILQALVFGLVVLGILWRGAHAVADGTMTIGELVLVNTYIIRFLQPVETLARIHREIQASAAQAKLLIQLLHEIPSPMPADPSLPSAGYDDPVTPPSLRMEHLEIQLDEEGILPGLTLSIPEGNRLFVVGPSGAGKSSLLRTISCLIAPKSGRYYIGNIEVSQANASRMRERISVAHQECLLFDMALKDNVAIGTKASPIEIENIMAELGLLEIKEQYFPQEHLTIGERGNRLSGGERKRISLARALLRKAPILLLDEPTASLDELNRARVIQALSKRRDLQTEVIVTHDIDWIASDEPVLFLKNRQEWLFGTHADLLKQSPDYASFAAGQESESEMTRALA